MDANFLQSLIGNMQPEDGSANPYAPPAIVPGADGRASSVLQTIIGGGQPPVAPQAAPQGQPAPQAAPQPAPVASAPADPLAYAPPTPAPQPGQQNERPKVRSSLLDHIGRLADVFANVGGAQAQYQPYLDARQARQIAMDDHGRSVQDSQQSFTKGQLEIQNTGIARTGMLVKGLAAIQASGGDPAKALPVLAQQLGIDPAHAEVIGQTIAQDPRNLTALNSSLNKAEKGELSLEPFYMKDANGQVHAYQLSKDGTQHEVKIDGQTPVGTGTGEIDTGPERVIYDKQTGAPIRRFVKGGGPATGEIPVVDAGGKVIGYRPAPGSRQEVDQKYVAAKTDKTAGPATEKGNPSEVFTLLDNIQNGFKDLHSLKALPGQGGDTVGNIMGAISRSSVGQAVGEQTGDPAAQKRLELAKNVSLLQQTLIKNLPASATRTKFEQEILKQSLPDPTKMTKATADTIIAQYRQIFQRAVKEAQGGTPAAPRSLPPRIGGPSAASKPVKPGRPTVSNW